MSLQCKGGNTCMNEQCVQHTYVQFKHEFERKLNRPLTGKEQNFLQWLAKNVC